MGAVLEGCENGISSIGFSLASHLPDADFSHFEPYVLKIAKRVLKNPFPYGYCLNINCPTGEIRGVKTVRQSKGRWTEEFDKRTDPYGQNYFWVTGFFKNDEPQATDTDEWALANGFISVVPTKIDMTAHELMAEFKGFEE
jgi:5'-nucleotidase